MVIMNKFLKNHGYNEQNFDFLDDHSWYLDKNQTKYEKIDFYFDKFETN